jgi:hypothetical protein
MKPVAHGCISRLSFPHQQSLSSTETKLRSICRHVPPRQNHQPIFPPTTVLYSCIFGSIAAKNLKGPTLLSSTDIVSFIFSQNIIESSRYLHHTVSSRLIQILFYLSPFLLSFFFLKTTRDSTVPPSLTASGGGFFFGREFFICLVGLRGVGQVEEEESRILYFFTIP